MSEHTTVTGTGNADSIDTSGASAPHLIFGLARNDTIVGTAFDDTIDGGRDNDSLAGGDGNDVFLVEGGNQGVDRFDGGAGFDRVRGGAGDDHFGIASLVSVEEIDGGAGRNTIGGSSSDNLLDFSGTALLNISLIDGGRGDDTVIGTGLDDTIEGGDDNDSLSGGDGNDTFLVTGSKQGADRVDGGAGFDRILGSAGDDDISLASMTAIERIDGGGGSDTVSGTGNSEVLDLSGVTLVNIALIDGGRGNDTIIGTSSDDTIMGERGSDSLVGGGGTDVAVYFGNQADYEITVDGDGVAAVSGGNEGGTDRLVNISFLSFADGIVDLTGGSGGTPPIAQNDAATTDEETAIVLDVLSNDSSQTGGTLELLSVTQGANGTVQANVDGTVTYTPGLDFFGDDTFTYQVGDGSPGSSMATVTVTVLNQPDSPVAADDSATTLAGSPVVIDVLANDRDPDGTQPILLDFGQGAGGSVTENADGTLTYTPDAGTLGQDSFAYTITDGTTTDTATATVTVQDEPPPPGPDDPADDPVVLSGTADDDLLDASGASAPHLIFGLARNDTIVGTGFDDTIDGGRDNDSLAGGDGNDVFLVEGGNQGVDRFDGGAGFDRIRGGAGDDHFGIASLVSVEEIDGGAGSNTIGGSSSDNLLDFSGTALLNISLIDGGRGNDTIIGTGLDDTIEGGDDNDSLSGGDGNDTFLVTGSKQGADRVDGGAGFDRILGSAGDDEISLASLTAIERIDGGGGSDTVSGTGNSEVLDLSGVSLVNIALIDGGRGNDTIIGTSSDDTIMGERGSDSLVGGGGTDVAVYFGNQADYEITVDGDGVAAVSGGNEGGTDRLVNISFLSFADGIVDLTGGSGGTPPIAQDDAATTDEETAIVLDVLSNDSSQTGGALELLSVTQGANGTVQLNGDGTVTYTPALDFFGNDSFTYQVGDGSPGSSMATVTVTVLNQPDSPVAADDSATTLAGSPVVIDVLANDRDPDGTQPILLDFGQGAGGSVTENANGTLTYTPDAGTLGQDSFAYTITDGTTTDTATVTVTVQDEPPPPGSMTFRQLLTSMPEGDWLQMSTNIFKDVWVPKAQWANDNPSPASVIGAWSSMAWDSNRGDLIFWGGGHATYAGNEVYRWRSSTLEWERASLPSEVIKLPDGRSDTIDGHLNSPLSSHTYDNNEFLPIADRFITFGGAALGAGGNFRTTDTGRATGPYLWDPSKADGDKVGGITGSQVHPELFPDVLGGQMWENRDNLYISEEGLRFVTGVTAYAQEDGHDVVYVGRKSLYKYTLVDIDDPSLDRWEKVGNYKETFGKDGPGALDTANNVFVRIAGSGFTYWDLDNAAPNNPNVRFQAFDATGTFASTPINDYGMDFDPVREVFVLWNGSAEVWTLTPPEILGREGWILEPLPAGPSVGPDEFGQTSGVLGKWKYVAEQDIFIGVNDQIEGDIWAYKPEGWQPANSLPEISLAGTGTFTLSASDNLLLTDLIQWSDADGDLLSFEIVDLTDSAASGFFQLGGTALAAETPIVVEPDEIISGELVWISGQPGVFDDILITVSDPFGSAPQLALRLPGESSGLSTSMVVADAAPAPLDVADLLPESGTEEDSPFSDVAGGNSGVQAASLSGNSGAGPAGPAATSLLSGLDGDTEQQILAQA